MTYIAVLELAVIALLLYVNTRERATHDKTILDLIASNETERQLLLDRIQSPGTVVAPARLTPQPEPQPDELERLRRAYEQEHAS